jgi:uncharacterized repeat protein (TIGR03803 family)
MRQTTRRIALFFCFTLSLGVLSNLAQAQTYTVLYTPDGAPTGGLILDQQGRIYGTTAYGGTRGGGQVFRLAREGEGWVFSTIYGFGYQDQDGSEPLAGVVFGPDGALYGTTDAYGAYGYGTVYRLQPPATVCHAVTCPWTETILYNFTGGADGGYPGYGSLVFDQAGNIYGTTYLGGVFKLTRSGSGWTESVIWNGAANSLTGVVFDSAGNLFGSTAGSVYELSPTQSGWTEKTLYTGEDAGSGVTLDAYCDIFGISGAGPEGANNGVVYQLSPLNGAWFLTQLQDFGDQYFGSIAPPTFDSQGNVYGPIPSWPSQGNGEIFKLSRSGDQWIYTPYHEFTGGSGGAGPIGAVVFDANGNMYGTTSGVVIGGEGTVWEITP